jgi:hypothetical protein
LFIDGNFILQNTFCFFPPALAEIVDISEVSTYAPLMIDSVACNKCEALKYNTAFNLISVTQKVKALPPDERN